MIQEQEEEDIHKQEHLEKFKDFSNRQQRGEAKWWPNKNPNPLLYKINEYLTSKPDVSENIITLLTAKVYDNL